MVEYCAVLILDNEQVVTDYYYRDYKSSLKRRIMGLEGTYDYMPITTLRHIVKNSNKIYLYNGSKELDGYKIGMQRLIDIGTDLDKIVVMEPKMNLRITGNSNGKDYKKLIEAVFDGSDFKIPEDKILKLDVLKYCLAGFTKVYTNIANSVHNEIKKDAINQYNEIYDSMYEKYTEYKELKANGNYNVPLKVYLRRSAKQYRIDGSTEVEKEITIDRNKLVNSERSSKGLDKILTFSKNGTLIHGYTQKYLYKRYNKELRQNYNFIRLEGWGHSLEIQTGKKSGISEEGKTNLEIYKQYYYMYKDMNIENNIKTEDGKDLYTVNLLDLIRTCYDNDIFIYEANIHYIELIFRKDRNIEEVKETVSNILNKTEFKDKLTIKIKEEQ